MGEFGQASPLPGVENPKELENPHPPIPSRGDRIYVLDALQT